MEQGNIIIKNARVNNLKGISLEIPRGKLIVISGVSGSGKSSLAFDTLYAEGQRRYVESLSAYARQFLGKMNKPECDLIEGLPPAIAIEQRVTSGNPRSTVGTSTEIYEYLRLLYARIGHTFSPISGQEVKKHSIEDILECVKGYSEGTVFYVLSPLEKREDRSEREQLGIYLQQGYTRILVKNEVVRIEDVLEQGVSEGFFNDVFLLVDRLRISGDTDFQSRLFDSSETAMYEGHGKARLMFLPSNIVYDFSNSFTLDGMQFQEPTDNMFSFHSPYGACPKCEGLGMVIDVDESLVVPNSSLSVYDGCVQCWHGDVMGQWQQEFVRRAKADDFPIFKPYMDLTSKEKQWLWQGLPSQKHLPEAERVSINAFFLMLKSNLQKIQYRVMLSRYRGRTKCPECHGTRLRKEAGYVLVDGKSIQNLVDMPITALKDFFDNITLSERDLRVAKRLLVEIKSRLRFLVDVGLGYLTLNRNSNTLSGGESQRIRLTTSLGSSLVGSLYILDEPSIGLHSHDTDRLISVLKALRDIGNTVVVVEHDEEMIREADFLVDMGPDAGNLGGEVVFSGAVNDVRKQAEAFPKSYTLQYMSRNLGIKTPKSRRRWNNYIELLGVRMNNLRSVNVRFPLNVLTVVTGVSGSGKSTLVNGVLYLALKRNIGEVAERPGEYDALQGSWREIERVEKVDQNSIGKSTRSNPVTYLKVFEQIRQLFASQPLAQQMGFSAKYFSFNTEGGRCEECKGAGTLTIEMQFMADMELVCDACHGKRYKQEVLDVLFHGKNICDVLDMTVSEAIDFFNLHNEKSIASGLQPLDDVGLGYIKLGQSSSTLSGGENQRVKLAYHIAQQRMVPTLFIFDEPTTGLHSNDIKKLLRAFDALLLKGHTVLVIEHNLDIIKSADHVIDLGPDGGLAGGKIVVSGTPEEVAKCKESHTGKYLKAKLEAEKQGNKG